MKAVIACMAGGFDGPSPPCYRLHGDSSISLSELDMETNPYSRLFMCNRIAASYELQFSEWK